MTQQPNQNHSARFVAFTILVSALVCLFSGCTSVLPPLLSFAHFEKPVDASASLSNNTAIVYGRFLKAKDFAFGNQLALQICNLNTKRQWLIQFKPTNAVFGIVVEPGRYRVVGMVETFVERRTAGTTTFPDTPIFDVLPNTITYIGDYKGGTRMHGMDQVWYFAGVSNNFSVTTQEFETSHPNLPHDAYTAATEMVNAFANLSLSPIEKIKDPAHIDGAVKPYYNSAGPVIDAGEYSKDWLPKTNRSSSAPSRRCANRGRT